MKVIPESGIAKAIELELKIEDPTEEVAKGVLNDARTTRDLPEGHCKDKNCICLPR